MAITLGVGPALGANVGTSSTITITLAGTTAGRSLVVPVAWSPTVNGGDTITSVTCSGESDLTLHGSTVVNSASTRKSRIASLANITTGGDKTITVTFSHGATGSGNCIAAAIEFAGGDTSDWFEAWAGQEGFSSTPSVNVTTATDGSLLVGIVIGTLISSAGSGFTLVTGFDGANASKYVEYDLDAGTAGSKSVGFTMDSTWYYSLSAVAFNAVDNTREGTLTKTEAGDTLVSAGNVPVVGTLTKTEAGDTIAAEGIEGSFVTGNLTKTEAADIIAAAGNVPVNGTLAKVEGQDTFNATAVVANTAIGSGTLPLFTLAASSGNGVGATFPLLTLEAEGVAGSVASLESVFPLPQLTALGTGENTGALAGTLPVLTLFAGDGGGLIEALPLLTVEATSVTGTLSTLEAVLPLLTLSAAGDFTNLGALSASLSSLQGYGTGVHGVTAEATITLPTLRLETAGESGELATASIVLPSLTLFAAGYIAVTGTALLVLPSLLLSASGAPALPATYRTWVVNLKTRAVTEYTGFTFNSYANFDGRVLAASGSGIFELNSATADNATDIDGVLRTGKHAYETSYLKRVPRLYLSYSAPAGDLEVRTITSEDGRRRYLLRHNGITGVQQRRVPVGKGPKSKYWQFELANRSGSDFELDGFIVYPQVLGVRAQ